MLRGQVGKDAHSAMLYKRMAIWLQTKILISIPGMS